MQSATDSPSPPASALAAKLAEVELAPGSVVVADLHLEPAHADAAGAFADLCSRIAGAPRLVVLGDLFDAWIGPAHLELPGARAVTRALRTLTDSGTAVEVVHGNRDFLLDAAFERVTGARVHPHGLVGRLPGHARVLLLHGDELCTRDRAYQRLRRVVRSSFVTGLAASVPLPIALFVARRLRRASKQAVAAKLPEEKAMQEPAARELAALRDASIVVTGHAHDARDTALVDGPRWIVLDAFGGVRDAFVVGDAGGGELVRSAELARSSPGHARGATIDVMSVPSTRTLEEERETSQKVVAIDGPAASGKSSVGRRVAERLGLAFLDTGLLYRAAALAVVRAGVRPDDGSACAEALRALALDLDAEGRLHVDGREADLRSDAVERIVSQVSAHPEVRRELLPLQHALAERLGGLVAVGRDVTTVVFPNTPHRYYLDASLEERVRRRVLERCTRTEPVDEEAIRAGIRARDQRDSTRSDAPLTKHPEARVIQTDGHSLEDVVELVVRGVEGR